MDNHTDLVLRNLSNLVDVRCSEKNKNILGFTLLGEDYNIDFIRTGGRFVGSYILYFPKQNIKLINHGFSLLENTIGLFHLTNLISENEVISGIDLLNYRAESEHLLKKAARINSLGWHIFLNGLSQNSNLTDSQPTR